MAYQNAGFYGLAGWKFIALHFKHFAMQFEAKKRIICSFLLVISLLNSVRVLAYPPDISWWLTTGNQVSLLQKQNTPLVFGSNANPAVVINVDSTKKYQQIDGFGFALTGSSALVINQMPAANRSVLLSELFGRFGDGIAISYLRISIGASDLSPTVYTYDDLGAGETDEALTRFDLGKDKATLVPLLQQILKKSPNIKIVASPWSAPAWMKDNNSMIGGSLQAKYYGVYAAYFVKYIQAMKQAGINIEAVTVQNEPLNPNNNPSMSMTAEQQLAFVKGYLGPAFSKQGIKTKIIIWDHNCDNTSYAKTILTDAAAAQYIDGTAFHLYKGDIGAMGQVHSAFPEKNLYFTEQYTASDGDFGGDLKWHVKNVLIGAVRNWSRNVLEWNLASDAGYVPHTQGGCSKCQGALTISGAVVKRNVSYYIIGHAAKFVPPGSVRIWSNQEGNLNTVAFITPTGGKVLIVENDGSGTLSFGIKFNNNVTTATLDGGSIATYVW